MMEEVKERAGCVDFLINNAAILRDQTLRRMALEDWQAVIDIDLTGVRLRPGIATLCIGGGMGIAAAIERD